MLLHNSKIEHVDINAVTLKAHSRKKMGDLSTLVSSILNLGLINPITIDKNNVLISGLRRLEACKLAKLNTIPAIRIDTTYDSVEALSVKIDENLCRAPLNHDDLEAFIDQKKAKVENVLDKDSATASWLWGILSRAQVN